MEKFSAAELKEMMIAEQLIPLGDKAAIVRTLYTGAIVRFVGACFTAKRDVVDKLWKSVQTYFYAMVGPQPKPKPMSLKEMLRKAGR